MIKKILKELWDIFKYFSHLETMKHCDKYERYYPEKDDEQTITEDEAFVACYKIRQFIKDDEKRCYRILKELGVKMA